MDSPELRQFLKTEDLEDGCYVTHIGQNYKGHDRPKSGLLKWLRGINTIEVIDDTVVKVKAAATADADQSASAMPFPRVIAPPSRSALAAEQAPRPKTAIRNAAAPSRGLGVARPSSAPEELVALPSQHEPSLGAQLAEATARAERAEARADRTEAHLSALRTISPFLDEVVKFHLEDLPYLRAKGEFHYVPVQAILWTHDTVDSRSSFKCEAKSRDDADDMGGASIYKLLDELWRGAKDKERIVPMDVVRHEGRLYSLANRRLSTYSMLQGLRRDRTVKVLIKLWDKQDEPWVLPKFERSFSNGDRKGLGIELAPRKGGFAMHEGAPTFGVGVGGDRFKKQVRKIFKDHPVDVNGDIAKMLLRLKQRRSLGSLSEFSLSVCPSRRVRSSRSSAAPLSPPQRPLPSSLPPRGKDLGWQRRPPTAAPPWKRARDS